MKLDTRRFRTCYAALLALVGLALVAAGCGEGDTGEDGAADQSEAAADLGGDDLDEEQTEDGQSDDAADDTAAETTTVPETDTTATLVEDSSAAQDTTGPQVVLLEPGAEPRTPLRLQLVDGQTEVMIMEQTQEISQAMDGTALPGTGAISSVVTSDILVAVEGGQITATSTLTEARAADDTDPALATQLDASLASLVGLSSVATMDDRGRLLSSEISGTEGLDPSMAQTMEQLVNGGQLANPLPDEPVGVGARWQTTQILMTNGLEIAQTATYELGSIDGTVLELTVSVEQDVPPGSVMSALGVPMSVLNWVSQASGALTLDLSRVVPLSSTVDAQASQDFETTEGELTRTIEVAVDSSIAVRPG